MNLALDLTTTSSIGYPVIFFGVLLGSIIPIVPTGAVVGAGAAVAMTTTGLSLPLVLLLSTLGAYVGDVATYAIARLGGDPAVRWLARHQHADRVASIREQFSRRGWQILVVGRLLPAGRIPVLLAAGALAYPWRRFLPTALIASLIWAAAYALLGVASGGIFDSPLVASLIATALVLVVTVLMAVIARHQHRAPDAGKLLRGGRATARLLLIWIIVTAALRAFDSLLPGFTMTQWWQPTVCALILGLIATVVWPLILRIALPFALFTLGLGSFIVIGAGALAIFNTVPGVEIENLRTAVAVTIGMAAVGALMSSVLAIDDDEIFFRRIARRGGTPKEMPHDTPPGVVFLQVDGLGYETVRRAVRDGDMPTLAAWLNEDTHTLTMWHTDWSSQTGASVSGILHGDNHDILGFRWYEKDRDHVMACAHPRDAAEIERRHSNGKGLLSGGGAGHGNLFTGDADHVTLTMSAVPVLGKGVRRGRHAKTGYGYYTYFARPVNVVRTFGSAIVDIVREIWASTSQKRRGVKPRIKRGGFYPIARSGTTVITRDVVVSAIIEDILAGRPVVYADFLGYDEVAHHSGIERFDALAVLRGIDQQIGRLHRATRLGPRPYYLVVLSDHGQTQGWAFANRFGEPIEKLIGRLCGGEPSDISKVTKPRNAAEGWQMNAALAEGGLIARRLRGRVERAGVSRELHRSPSGEPGEVARVAPGVVVVVSGHVAMVSFTEHEGRVPLETIEREYPELLPQLVDHPGVGFMLVRSSEFGPVVLGRDGLHRLATGVVIGEDPLKDYGPHAADLIRRTDEFPHCADIMINSRYEPETQTASPFEPHVGSHGGLGGPQTQGFLVYPTEFMPAADVVGAEALHQLFREWLTELGHPAPAEAAEEKVSAAVPLP
ncbi:VTT domain-containing protein [Kibdelosporangium aridum]|uniref:Membrane protein DedA, SNARE-associated domain n=1 Tax=Kibdelosporangium aridum TaxID=2030 RepID=A0A1W2D4Z9_KIBAR|nr:VTT domain-containing protein [Kibdelosporangium aridum]SMC92501.1 membrane protein DedA, SNARE-associated domain [Kibdelosporangium aridum]